MTFQPNLSPPQSNFVPIRDVSIRQQADEGMYLRNRFYCGFCHQRSILLIDDLQKNGFDARPYLLNGHVVSLVKINGIDYVADPDFGIQIFEYYDDNIQLDQAVRAAYAQFNANELAGYYTDRTNDGTYYTHTLVFRIKLIQRTVLWAANVVSVLGIALFILALIWTGRRLATRH